MSTVIKNNTENDVNWGMTIIPAYGELNISLSEVFSCVCKITIEQYIVIVDMLRESALQVVLNDVALPYNGNYTKETSAGVWLEHFYQDPINTIKGDLEIGGQAGVLINIDGGASNSNYGSIEPVDGGNAGSF